MSSSSPLLLLFESSLGLALFEKLQADQVALGRDEMQQAISDFSLFSKMVRLVAFKAFENSTIALQVMNELVAGECGSFTTQFLQENLPAGKKEKKKPEKTSAFRLGVLDKALGGGIKAGLNVECVSDEMSLELLRGIRQHAAKLLLPGQSTSEQTATLLAKAQLGLGHSYSRAKVKFNVHRVDNMIIQAICLLDQLDKDINTLAMRVKEWYGWHFPELAKLLSGDISTYAKCVLAIGNDKSALTSHSAAALEASLQGDDSLQPAHTAALIIQAAQTSMGTDISPLDLINIRRFSEQVVSLTAYRAQLSEYLSEKMKIVAPNLTELIGQTVGARLISHAGSLSNLAKCPASTVQILGAEKALFRSLKSKDGKTPKYGLLFHSAAIGKATSTKNKGRISRYLANKCSLASRIDCFSETPLPLYGDALRQQVEERLEFLDSGKTPQRNIKVMHSVTKKVKKLLKAQ